MLQACVVSIVGRNSPFVKAILDIFCSEKIFDKFNVGIFDGLSDFLNRNVDKKKSAFSFVISYSRCLWQVII